MLIKKQLEQFRELSRKVEAPTSENTDQLGPLSQLAGTWKSDGHGWNMIALPWAPQKPGQPPYRLLMNQYDECLQFGPIHSPVPNRGIDFHDKKPPTEADQFIAAIEYNQSVTQVDADDFPQSKPSVKDANGSVIHGEPGLWLHITNQTTNDLDLARLGSVPHGNSLLALGGSTVYKGAPNIQNLDGRPIGLENEDVMDPNNVYMEPYRHYANNPFPGTIPPAAKIGFDPLKANALLRLANENRNFISTTEIVVDTTKQQAGIVNIPFIVKQAEATKMKFTFWISELDEKNPDGSQKLQLQYSQVVILDFFNKNDGQPGRIEWPHISINTLEKISNDIVDC